MPLNDTIDKLADFQPTALPVISLYLNTQADQLGRDPKGAMGNERAIIIVAEEAKRVNR